MYDTTKKKKADMISLRNKGMSYAKIGEIYGVSKQRVHQIINSENYEKIKKNYYERNKERLNEKCRKWRANHRQKTREYAKAYYRSHKDYYRNWYIENRDRVYYKNHPEKVRP